MKVKIVLENASGHLDESEPFDVLDEDSVEAEVLAALEESDWALQPGDLIRIVEVA